MSCVTLVIYPYSALYLRTLFRFVTVIGQEVEKDMGSSWPRKLELPLSLVVDDVTTFISQYEVELQQLQEKSFQKFERDLSKYLNAAPEASLKKVSESHGI